MTTLLKLGILFSIAVSTVLVAMSGISGMLFSTSFILVLRAVVVAKLVILGILFLTAFILALRVVLLAKLVISGISSSIFFILALYTSFLTTSFFTTSLSLLYQQEQALILTTSNLSTLLFKLFKLVGTNLCTLDFKLAKSTFGANFDVNNCCIF